MTTKPGKSVYLQAVTMIGPATARADHVANQVELAWSTHYPLPNKVIMDRENEFLAKFRKMITNDYSIMVKPITSINPQTNVLLEKCTKQMVIFYALSKYKTWYWIMKIYGAIY